MLSSPETVVLEGEIDLEASRSLTPRLSAVVGAAAGDLVIDLTDVTFIDSTGLGAILQTHLRLARQGRRLALIVPEGSSVAVLLNLSGMDGRLLVFASRADADAAA